MQKETKETASGERLKDLPVQSENPAFAASEMTACAECARANSPTRAACLYCGASLEISAAQSKFLTLRPLETWEKGFNLIAAPVSENFDESQIEKIAASLNVEAKMLRRIIESKKRLPLARAATKTEAETVQNNLRETANLETAIVGDQELDAKNPPRRLSAMDFSDEKLVLVFFNRDEIAEIFWKDLILIVTGAIFERRVESTERRGRQGEIKLLETNETASDEILFDFYSRDDGTGFRVERQGFDFSCLGADKGWLAAENMRLLVEELSRRAPRAKIVEDYAQIRAQLAAVWAVEETTGSRGLKRDGFAKFNRENVTTISNAAQFVKYSRLQRLFI